MKKQMQKIFTLIVGIIFTVSFLALPARADQPYMRAAKENLDDAMKSLKKASADKGGYRERAMNLVSQAIGSVNNGISYDRQIPNGRGRRNDAGLENVFVQTRTNFNFDQPNMEKALSYLQSALANLNRASTDKGGYRVQAMNLVREAIKAVNDGIEYDRTHD
jgi:hypothetical protein